MARNAVKISANTFQFFSRNPRGGQAKAFDRADADAYLAYAEAHDIQAILAHAPYTLNLCSKDPGLRAFAVRAMQEDLERLEYFPGTIYNFHPGSHVGQGVEVGIELIVEGLDQVLRDDQKTTVVLETMAGRGSEVGSTFEELRAIIDRVKLGDRLGVCLDTCHIYDAGYDIKNDLDGVLEHFDNVLGLDRLKAIHLNDSKNPFNSRKDRHEKIGKGEIGDDALRSVINHPVLRTLGFYLETPNELPGYAEEIRLLRSWRDD